MFLVADRVDPSRGEPLFRSFRETTIRHPERLHVGWWDIRAAESWLVVGGIPALTSLVSVLHDWPEYAQEGAFAGQPAKVAIVGATDNRPKPSLWQRVKQRLGFGGGAQNEPFSDAWLADLPPGNILEKQRLVEIGCALAGPADVLVLDRLLQELRPEVRFRLSTHLQLFVDNEGLTVITLADSDFEGWVAADRTAILRHGNFELIQRRDLADMVGF